MPKTTSNSNDVQLLREISTIAKEIGVNAEVDKSNMVLIIVETGCIFKSSSFMNALQDIKCIRKIKESAIKLADELKISFKNNQVEISNQSTNWFGHPITALAFIQGYEAK